ncbi:hypothetical protein BH23BAC2_BH23BAC2_22470 [soil metagenome]
MGTINRLSSPHMKRFLAFLFLIFSFSGSFAQPEYINPTKRVTFGDKKHTNRDYLFFSEMNNRGQLIVAGITEKDYSFTDVQVKALNKDLEVLWSVDLSYEGISYDYPMELLIDKHDHIWVVSKNLVNLGQVNFVITRVDPNGKVLWDYISPEPLETSTLNMKQHFQYIGEDGYLNFYYKEQGMGSYNGTPTFFKISPQGVFSSKYEYNRKILHLSQHNGMYHGLHYRDEEMEVYYTRFDENETLEILLENEIFLDAQNSLYNDETDVLTDKLGNLIYIGKEVSADIIDKQTGSVIYSVAPSGEFNYAIPNNRAINKYILGHKIDKHNNLVLLSNTQAVSAAGEPWLTLEIFSDKGEVLFHKVDETVVGNMASLEDEKIVVRSLDGNIFTYDYTLNELDFYKVNGEDKMFIPQSLQSMEGLPVLIGNTLESPYPGSDYMSGQDNLIRKFSAAGEIARYSYSGEGTSLLYTYNMFKSEEGNYIVQALEFNGPNNPSIGGSRAPADKKLLTFNSQLELLNIEIVEEFEEWQEPVTQFTTLAGDVLLYQFSEDKKKLKFYTNGNLTWERDFDYVVFYSKIDREGNLIVSTSTAHGQPGHLLKFTPQNEITLVSTGIQIMDFVVLSNNWIFTYFENQSINIFSPELELIKSRQPTYDEVADENHPYLMEKNNKVLFNIRGFKQVNIYDQFGNFLSNFTLDGTIHPSQVSFNDQDALVVYHSVGNGIPLEHAYQWARGVLSQYDNIVGDYIGGLPEGDSDGDGVDDFYDQCPDTPIGTTMVNVKGCEILALSEGFFNLKVTAETCPGKNNGLLEITALQAGDYRIELRGETTSFTQSKILTELRPGNYEVCVWVHGEERTRRCYGFEIAGGESLMAGSRVSNLVNKKELEVNITNGTAPFEVFVNGLVLGTYNDSFIRIPVYSGDDVLIKSAVACEGNFFLKVEGTSGTKILPNPVTAEINLYLPQVTEQDFLVEVYNSSGQKIKSIWQTKGDRKFTIPAADLGRGMYFLRLHQEEIKTIKFLKL